MQAAQSGPNPLPPARMSAEDRVDELGRILAAALRRVLVEQSRTLSDAVGESSVDILALKRRVGRRKPSTRDGER
jgi:hypothetical protein